MTKQEKMDETMVAIKIKLDELLRYFEGRDSIILTPPMLISLNEFAAYIEELRCQLKGPVYIGIDGTQYIQMPVTKTIWGRIPTSVSFICNHLNDYITAFNKTFNMSIKPLPDHRKPVGGLR